MFLSHLNGKETLSVVPYTQKYTGNRDIRDSSTRAKTTDFKGYFERFKNKKHKRKKRKYKPTGRSVGRPKGRRP